MIAGEKVARTSNDAQGCTFNHERYDIPLDNMLCSLWDTTGLDEGSEGTVPARMAENNLRELMQELAHSGGIHLVIYCVRGSRLTRALRRNYDLFYVTICRRKVPVALVVTGLEHQEGEMETWWTENEGALRRHGMRFDAHACVTTVNAIDPVLRQRRSESRAQLCELILKYAVLPGWKADASFLSRIMPLFLNAFRGLSSTGSSGNTKDPRKVIICGSFPGISARWDQRMIGKRKYDFLRVDKYAVETTAPRTCVGVGLLVFYTSALVDNRIRQSDVVGLKNFYHVAGGESCPMIVVLQGCDDEQVARDNEVKMRYSNIQAHFVPVLNTKDAEAMLDEMIDSMCMDQAEVKGTGNFWRMFG